MYSLRQKRIEATELYLNRSVGGDWYAESSKTTAPKSTTHLPMILKHLFVCVRSIRMRALTSTHQPSFFMCSQSSREVLTLLESTAVHVGRMAPSPSSKAKNIHDTCHMINMRQSYLPISLCVSTSPPNLHSKERDIVSIKVGATINNRT
jgi:hypothetical protein